VFESAWSVAVKPSISLQAGDALIIVDVQNDFLANGALAVPNGNAVIPVLNRYLTAFRDKGLANVATRDWHPSNHCSFETQGGPWPPHCVQGTRGAQFPSDLDLGQDTTVISTASTPEREVYSGFQETDLHERLQRNGIKRLFIGGIATDYCVLATVKDGLRLGYKVFLLTDAVRAVNVKTGDGQKAEQEMVSRGAIPVTIGEIQ
jgi:nicotinamidase/pyrazinamidase